MSSIGNCGANVPFNMEAAIRPATILQTGVDATVAYYGCNGEEYIEAYPAVKID